MSTSITKTILVLANSKKKGGRCVAGLVITSAGGDEYNLGEWIRPIDPEQDEGTIPDHRIVVGMRLLKPLDCVKIRFTGPANDPFHPEDFKIDTSQKWERDGTMSKAVFDCLPDESEDLWGASTASSRKVVPKEGVRTLCLVKPKGTCYVTAYREDTPWGVKHRRFLYITHEGALHKFNVDDPYFSEQHNLSPQAVGDKEVRVNLDPSRTVIITSLTKP